MEMLRSPDTGNPNSLYMPTQARSNPALVGGLSFKQLKKALRLGQKHAEKQEWAESVKHLLVAWDAIPEDINILTLLAHSLVQLGVRDKAIAVLERALTIHEPTHGLIDVIQRLAMAMDMNDIAVKLGEQLIVMEPQEPLYYVNLATAYSGEERLDDSIAMLQQVIPHFPDNAALWNVLATQVRQRDGSEACYVFYEEALKHAPNSSVILGNYSHARLMAMEFDAALELGQRAIAANPNSAEPRISVGQLLFLKGQLEEGWQHYEFRNDQRRTSKQTQHYTHGLPIWNGEDLSGKSILLAAEQGIGDEVMWGNFFPFMKDKAARIIIGCDQRLVSIYKRRFPDAEVCAYADRMISGYRYRVFPEIEAKMKSGDLKVDYACMVGSAPKFDWVNPDQIKPHEDGFIVSDPQLRDDMKAKLDKISSKPKVGLAWRSGLMTAERNHLYASIEALGPIMALSEHVDFINLQYGDVSAELDAIEDMHGVTVHALEGVDLKADIEANLAIMGNCDIVVSSCSAPGIFSMSLGRPTLLMSSGKPWWSFGAGNIAPFAKDTELFADGKGTDWTAMLGRVADRVKERLVL